MRFGEVESQTWGFRAAPVCVLFHTFIYLFLELCSLLLFYFYPGEKMFLDAAKTRWFEFALTVYQGAAAAERGERGAALPGFRRSFCVVGG